MRPRPTLSGSFPEAEFRRRQIFWTRNAALAACTAALAAGIGWAWTIFH